MKLGAREYAAGASAPWLSARYGAGERTIAARAGAAREALNHAAAAMTERFRLLSEPYGIDALAPVPGETLAEARDHIRTETA